MALPAFDASVLRSLYRLLLILAICPLCWAQGSAFATRNSIALEEVIVTAQKEFQTIQDVPLSITAFDESAVKRYGIMDIMDLTALTPGFSMSNFNLGQPQPYIRGIGSNEDSAGGDSSVVVYLDGVYIARASASAFNYYDIARIEVLRGPQGTLYGKNAIGGVINVISKQPQNTLSGAAEATLGKYDWREIKGRINVPLSDRIYSNAAINHIQRDGYVDNKLSGTDLHNWDDLAGHLQLLVLLSDDLEMIISLDSERVDRSGNGRKGFGPGAISTSNIREVFADTDGFQQRDGVGARVEFNWELDEITLTSLSASRESNYDWLEDLNGTSGVSDINDSVNETSEQLSQEFRVGYSGDKFEGVAGLYFLKEQAQRIERFDFIFVGGAFNQFNQRNDAISQAIFGQLSYQVDDVWSLIVGGRYTQEEKDFANRSSGYPGFQLLTSEDYDIEASEDWDATTYRLALEYQLDEEVKIYSSIDKGFKSGGFQGQATEGIAASTPFDPEFAVNYELGLKSQWLANSLRFNASLFYVDYTDLQVLQFISVSENASVQVTENAADAVSKGIETELYWQVNAPFRLTVNYAYNDTEYKNFFSASGDLSGNQLRNAPRNSRSISGEYVYFLEAGDSITYFSTYSYRDSTYQDVNNYELNKFDSKEILDFSIKYTDPTESYSLKLFFKNITNNKYQSHTFQQNSGANSYQLFASPFTAGVTADYQF